MTELEKREKRCCFTGHRPEKLLDSETKIKSGLARAIEDALAAGKRTFITGMARGTDSSYQNTLLAKSKHHLKNQK